MRASIPTNVVDNTYATFPAGVYTGGLASAEQRDPQGSGEWLTLKVGFNEVTPNEGTEDPGRSSFAADITIRTGGFDVTEIEDFSKRDIPFAIVRSAGLLASMAEALGVASRENGRVDVDIRQVVDALTEGNFAGERISFEVSHYTPKNSPDKVYEQFAHFGMAG